MGYMMIDYERRLQRQRERMAKLWIQRDDMLTTLSRVAELSDTSKDDGPGTRYWNIAEINDLCKDALGDDNA